MRIFAFGDSYTNSYNDTAAKWVKEYIDWKGYKPKSYIDLLSEIYDATAFNFAKQGLDNYSILESFCENFQFFNDEDLIILQWSYSERFRIVDTKNNWRSIIPNFHNNNYKDIDINKKCLENILINRTSTKYVEELNIWINFISFICRNNRIIQWSPITNYKLNVDFVASNYENISIETKQKIKDGHFSENGNKELSNYIRLFVEKKYNITKKTII